MVDLKRPLEKGKCRLAGLLIVIRILFLREFTLKLLAPYKLTVSTFCHKLVELLINSREGLAFVKLEVGGQHGCEAWIENLHEQGYLFAFFH